MQKNQSANQIPKKVAKRHRPTLSNTLVTATTILPDVIKFTVSSEKVENVVKPPKKPINQKQLKAW